MVNRRCFICDREIGGATGREYMAVGRNLSVCWQEADCGAPKPHQLALGFAPVVGANRKYDCLSFIANEDDRARL